MRAALRHAALLLALLSPAVASAQKPPPPQDRQDVARTKAQEGLKLFGADRFTEALGTFVEADRLYHAPSVTLYIARCQRKLGKLLDARATYERILAEDLPKDASPQFVQAHVEAGREVESLKQRIPTLQVTVTGIPAGEAQVLLDGAPLAEGQKELDPGTYTVEVRRRGVTVSTQKVTLAEGKPQVIPVDLGPGGGGGPGGQGSLGWIVPGSIAAGIGVVSLGVGAITGALSLSKVSDIKKSCTNNVCPMTLAGEGDSARLLGNVSTATLVVGGVGVAAGVALFLMMKPVARARVGQVEWRASVGPRSIGLDGRF